MTIQITTTQPRQAIDITDHVDQVSADWSGHFVVRVPHTTCALVLSEVDDELLRDWAKVGERLLAPFEPFEHVRNDNPNAAAHILASMLGSTLLLERVDGSIALGTYQRVVLVELDGPTTRTVAMTPLRSG